MQFTVEYTVKLIELKDGRTTIITLPRIYEIYNKFRQSANVWMSFFNLLSQLARRLFTIILAFVSIEPIRNYNVPMDGTPQKCVYLTFRASPTQSEPMFINSAALLAASNFSNSRRTVIVIHGWRDTPVSEFVVTVVPGMSNNDACYSSL